MIDAVKRAASDRKRELSDVTVTEMVGWLVEDNQIAEGDAESPVTVAAVEAVMALAGS